MLDFKKLDSFFDAKNLKGQTGKISAVARRARIIRLVKILLPAVAAALIGLLAIMPSLKDRANEFKIDITKPKLSELEKLHMENTVFHVTDKDNRVNEFTAESIDETETKSHLVKLTNPKAFMPSSDTDWLTVDAPTGYYNQEAKLLSLNENVVMKYSEGMTATTKEMFFDANISKAYSIEPVTAEGYFGDLSSNGFEYYKNKGIITFTKKTDIIINKDNLKGTKITADKKVDIYQKENKIVAVGNAKASKDNININADKLTAFFGKSDKLPNKGKTEITKFYADGNVEITSEQGKAWGNSFEYSAKNNTAVLKGKTSKLQSEKATISASKSITYLISHNKAIAIGDVVADNGKNKIYSDKMEAYFIKDQNNKTDLERVEIPKNPKVITETGEIKAKTGIYYPQTGMVMLFEDVEILHNGNIMKGDRAETNLNTGISKILAGGTKRVEGYILEETLSSDKQ